MSPSPDTDEEWYASLPALHGLFAKNTTSLLRPFSLFGISIFRSSPSLPPNSLLDPLHDLAADTNDVPLTLQSTVRPLIGLQSFAAQLREYSKAQKAPLEDAQVLERVGQLLEGYIAGVAVSARTLLLKSDPSEDKEFCDLREALKQCLEGVFAARSFLMVVGAGNLTSSGETATRTTDAQLLGAFFPPSETRYTAITPLIILSRGLLHSLQQPRPIHSLTGFKNPSLVIKTGSAAERASEENEVLSTLELLKTFVTGLEGIDLLTRPYASFSTTKENSKKAIRAEEEEDKRRPLRLAMDARVLQCDLALSMATRKMEDIKVRAAAKFGESGEDEDITEHEADEEENGEAEESETEDMKPRLTRSGEDEKIADTADRAGSPQARRAAALLGIRWESIAEDALVECLEAACQLLDSGRAEVLTSAVHAVDWVGQTGQNLHATNEKHRSRSPSAESGSDTDSSYELDLDATDSDGLEDESTTHPCPLRTIFRLHERFVEQRLGVWLHLPASKRGKMGAFMKGEDRRVGAAWDTMGLGLMLEYDSSTLLDYGLDADKLDKWLEIAAARNAKKIRRKGRKTI